MQFEENRKQFLKFRTLTFEAAMELIILLGDPKIIQRFREN